MLPVAYYLLKVTLISGVLFGYYWFFLRNKVFHAYNRFYLIAVIIFSVSLPLCRIHIFQETEAPKTNLIKMLQVVSAGDEFLDDVIIRSERRNMSFEEIVPLLYLTVSAILFVMLLQMLLHIRSLLKNNKITRTENIRFVHTDNAKGTPFSFFQYIFWNKDIDVESPDGKRIFRHEIAHIAEGHTWDKMFINVILIVFWSNPVFWIIRRELSMIHEFIADKHAVETGDSVAFASMILAASYPQHRFAITNNFFYSPIKRRLMMLTKKNNARINYISRLLALPLIVIVFVAFVLKAKEAKGIQNTSLAPVQKLLNTIAGTESGNENTTPLSVSNRDITVVIDAGHGGDDPGAKSENGTTEKELSLQLAKKIKTLNSNKHVKIILIRESDVFLSPKAKAEFAKAQNPDLFISVHQEGAPKEMWNKSTGMCVYVSNDNNPNSQKSKLFASALIGSFEKHYGLDVEKFPKQREKGILVLNANTFPSVLIEAGYLSNSKDVAYLLSPQGQETFAKNVLIAINDFAESKHITPSLETKNTYADTLGYYRGKAVVRVVMQPNKKTIKILYAAGGEESISMQAAIDAKLLPATATVNTVEVGVASEEDAELFKKLGRPFSRVEKDSKLPPTNKMLIVRDGIITNSFKLFKGDIIQILFNKEAIEKYGMKASVGALEITTKKISADPTLRIGNTNHSRISAEEFKKQKNVMVTGDYEFISATVWFSGNGYPNVVSAQLSGTELKPLNSLIEQCVQGSVVTFDNIKVKGKDGFIVIDGRSFALF